MSFEQLTPDTILDAVEKATDFHLTGLTSALPSYINRVYELRDKNGTKLVAKFYRPDRWSRETIMDEHRFVLDCAGAEIPVVAPLVLGNGSTLGEHDNVLFAVYPKRAGRQLEINEERDWERIGSLIARIHLAGETLIAPSRITIDPHLSAQRDVEHLCENIIPPHFREAYRSSAMQLIDASAPLFETVERIRIHGDFHRGNVLDRLDEGLLVIDFDDMAMGPPVQDIWLMLPDRADKAAHEIALLLQGYERFRRFDRQSIRCIESLRAMRMIYFLAWCSRQVDDFQFKRNFPNWGNDSFWQREVGDLREQLGFVMEQDSDGNAEAQW